MIEDTHEDEPRLTITIGPVERRRFTDEEMRRVQWLSDDPRRNRFVLTPDGELKRQLPLSVRIQDAAVLVMAILAAGVIAYGVLWIAWAFYISLGGGR